MRFVRAKFDEGAPGFTVRRNLLLNGVHYSPNDELSKDATSTRRLRQLYDTRKIDMLKVDEEQAHAEDKPKKSRKTKSIEIPAEWWKLPVDDLKQLSFAITGIAAPNRKEAIKTIRGYVDGLSA